MRSFIFLADNSGKGEIIHALLKEPQFQRILGPFEVVRVLPGEDLCLALSNGHRPRAVIASALILNARDVAELVSQIRQIRGCETIPIVQTRNFADRITHMEAYRAGVTSIVAFPNQMGLIRQRLLKSLTQISLVM